MEPVEVPDVPKTDEEIKELPILDLDEIESLKNPNEAAPAAEEVLELSDIQTEEIGEEAPEQQMTAWQYLMNVLFEARSVAQAISKGEPSREIALVVTKIDEAGLWLQTIDPANKPKPEPVDPSAADASDIWTPPGAGKLEVVGDPGTGQPEQPGSATEAAK